MFGLFSDYKSEDQINLEFAVKKLKAHYVMYSSLIQNWETTIMKNTKFLLYDNDIRGMEEMKGVFEKPHVLADFSRLFSQAEETGTKEIGQELEQKLTIVEMMMGNRMIKKNIAEKQIELCDSSMVKVSEAEEKVTLLKAQLFNYPKKVGEYNKKIGKGLLLRRRMLDVMDILDVIRFTKLLGGHSKRDMMKLLREQNWEELEPNRFLNVKSVKASFESLKKRLTHFEKEIKDEFCQLLQKPNLEGFTTLIDFLFAVRKRKQDWFNHNMKYKNSFKLEMDKLMNLLSDPDIYFNSTIDRIIDLWISPLRFSLGDFMEDDFSSPKKATQKKSLALSVEPTILITCIINVLDSLENAMTNWNRLVKYSFSYQNTLQNKITQEEDVIEYIELFRKHLFQNKSKLLEKSFTAIGKYIELIKTEQISRINPRNILKLRMHLSKVFKSAHLFSSVVPANQLEKEFQKLVECYLDQSLVSHVDLLATIVGASDNELTTFDYSTFKKQVNEVLTLTKEFQEEKWFVFGNGEEIFSKFKSELNSLLNTHSVCTDIDSLNDLLSKMQLHLNKMQPITFSEMNKETMVKVDNITSRQVSDNPIRIDTTGGMIASFTVIYIKYLFYLPEFSQQISSRVEFLFNLYYFLSANKILPPVTMQFLLSGGFNLSELSSEDSFPQLENFHDIVLFQRKFNKLRKSFKVIDTFLQGDQVPGLKEKIESSLTDLFAANISKSESKDKLGMSIQKVLKATHSFTNVNSLSIFFDHSEKIEEISDLFLYSTLLNHSKDTQVFSKISKVKWEEMKEAGQISDYVNDVTNSIKSLVSLTQKLGSKLSCSNGNRNQ